MDSHTSGQAFVKYIQDCCFHGELLYKDIYGQPLEKPVPLSVKMEEMLRTAQRQRMLHLQRRGFSAEQPDDMAMDSEDMKEIYNSWRKDVRSWMAPSTLKNY